jgi:hypothetical protein
MERCPSDAQRILSTERIPQPRQRERDVDDQDGAERRQAGEKHPTPYAPAMT